MNLQVCKAKILALTVAAAGRAWENKVGHGNGRYSATKGQKPRKHQIAKISWNRRKSPGCLILGLQVGDIIKRRAKAAQGMYVCIYVYIDRLD